MACMRHLWHVSRLDVLYSPPGFLRRLDASRRILIPALSVRYHCRVQVWMDGNDAAREIRPELFVPFRNPPLEEA